MRHESGKIYIYGKNALREALDSAPQVVRKVFLAPDMNDPELRDLIRSRNIEITLLKGREVEKKVGEDAVHQGVVAIVDTDKLMIDFRDFVRSFTPTEQTLLVLLDELTDPHNVGAIIRSAAAFGAAGVLMPSHHQAPLTGAVVKASAGMVFRVPIISIGNVNYTVSGLKDKGFRVYGLAMQGATSVTEEKFEEPTLVIIGNEGKGIRQKTLELCDATLRIPIDPRCESLNASVSAAVTLYEWSKCHPDVLQ